jgi:hypothetical protein
MAEFKIQMRCLLVGSASALSYFMTHFCNEMYLCYRLHQYHSNLWQFRTKGFTFLIIIIICISWVLARSVLKHEASLGIMSNYFPHCRSKSWNLVQFPGFERKVSSSASVLRKYPTLIVDKGCSCYQTGFLWFPPLSPCEYRNTNLKCIIASGPSA